MANIDSSIKKLLSTEIEKELTNIASSMESSMASKLVKPQEPDYIAALTCNFPNALKKILTSHIHYLKFRVCGCFIHQKPLVEFVDPKFSSMSSPEIGDLLIVYKEIDGKDAIYNALLLQAKVTKNKSATTTDAHHQLILYTKWPHFKYKKANHLNGEERDIYPKTIHSGAQYLLINNVTGKPLFGCATANKSLNVSLSFAEQLIRLIEFQAGGTFVSNKERIIDDWSKMIWDLLEISKDSKFNRKRSGFSEEPRADSDLIDEFMKLMSDDSKEDEEEAKERKEENEGCGISIILIKGELNGINKNKQNL